jgi:hypothetical protein
VGEIKAEFKFENGWLMGRLEGKPHFIPVSTAFEITRVLSDARRQLFALEIIATNYDDEKVTFRLHARDFFSLSVGRTEMVFARFGLIVDRLSMLIAYLRQTLPDTEPVIVDDLRFEDDDGNANRFFRSEFEKQRKRAIGKHFSYLHKPA